MPEHAPQHVVVVGAGLAGLRTVERLRRAGHSGTITLIGAEAAAPYDRPPLSKAVLTADEEPQPPHLRPAEAYSELSLDLRLGATAVGLDLARREVRLADGSAVAYDALVLATGSRARIPAAWTSASATHVLRTWEDAIALRRALVAAAGVGSAVVVGAGVLGCEIAAAARRHEVAVDLVDVADRPLARVVPAPVGAAVARLHATHGVTLRLGAGVASIDAAEGRPCVTLDDGTVLAPDLVVVAVGSAVDTGWLAEAGLAVEDGVVCDSEGRTSDPHVWAVGDIARLPHGSGSRRLEHWTAAGDGAARVAARILGQEPGAKVDVPYFWSDQYDAKIQTLGLPDDGDDLQVVAGALDEDRFLAVCSRGGLVTGVVGIGMPGQLMRCRTAVENGEPVADLVVRAPWDRKKPTT